MEGVELSYKRPGRTRRYAVIREERNQLQGLRNENHTEILVEVEFLKEENQEQYFKVSFLNYKQSNAQGMYKWVGDLHPLRKEIIFKTDENGMMGEIINLKNIRLKWNVLKGQVLIRHQDENHKLGMVNLITELLDDPERFSHALKYTAPYLYLFPGIYRKKLSRYEEVEGYRELPNFIGVKTIPVKTAEKITNYNASAGEYEVEVSGDIDRSRFDQEKMTALVRLLKNRLRAPVQVQLRYQERYQIDRHHWPLQSMCMSLVSIPGFLYREEKTIVKAI